MRPFNRSLRTLAAVATAALALSVAACGSAEGPDEPNGEFSGLVPVYTARQGGSSYVLGGGIATQMSKTIDGVQGSVEATTGTQEMLQRLTQKQEEGQIAFATPDATGTMRAVNGQDPFDTAYPDIRALATTQQAVIYMVAREGSGMDGLDDLEGKKVGLGVAGSVVNYLTKELLAEHGVAEGSYDEQPLGYQEVADGLANGSIDAGVIAGAPPVAMLTELSAQHDVTILGTDPTVMEELAESAPYVLDLEVEAGMYKNIDEPTGIFGFSVAAVTHKDTPDEAVTAMMDLLFTQQEELAKVHSSANGITFENATKGIAFDFHPAAQAYLEENGVDVP